MQGTVRLERDGNVAELVFDRPEKHNALTPAMYQQIVDFCYQINRDDTIHAVILWGAGEKAFCAGSDIVHPVAAFFMGGLGSLIFVYGFQWEQEKLRIDDVLGVWPLHGLCGVWGGIATGIFGTNPDISMTTQIIGTVSICAWAFVTMLALFAMLKAMGILRVSKEEEVAGLDITEHGMHAYPPNMVNESYTPGSSVPVSAS